MAALTEDRGYAAEEANGNTRDYLVAADAVLYRGAMACLDADGYLIAASDTAGISAVVGYVVRAADNTGGADGALSCPVRRGERAYMNTTGGSAIVQADVGQSCYVLDDNTVVKEAGTSNSIVAGEVLAVNTVDGAVRVTVKMGDA